MVRSKHVRQRNSLDSFKNPQHKENVPQGKRVEQKQDPSSIMQKSPTWSFLRCDIDGCWGINKNRLETEFWHKIFPRLRDFETMNWSEILMNAKKQNHTIVLSGLNKCARDRLEHLSLYDLDEIVSLRIESTIRIYGYLSESTFVLLWYDDGHGDNDLCVCRSNKKHT